MDFEDEARAIIAREVRAYLKRGQHVAALAVRAGLAPQTVARIAYGETLHPRMHSVVALLHAFGYRVTVKKGAPRRAVPPAPDARRSAATQLFH